MNATMSVLTVGWLNRFTRPPADVETIDGRHIWACTVLDRAYERAIQAEHMPKVRPGSGWNIGWTGVYPEPKQWSPERKAAARRQNLRRRLQRRFPLFAAELEERELERRAHYYDPHCIEAGMDMRPVNPSFRHNGGPPLDC
ncbi:hypothetical protein [Niveispirillum sp. SYP-B3756]|uniref:hypothetical protein n=1 Tax=Niveispirillum sp. SYP-B3756 TaxID=2662178 RepID=UPI001B3C0222|nr:hypothetical protein [Niveispirillum sp. SYP-B3756]